MSPAHRRPASEPLEPSAELSGALSGPEAQEPEIPELKKKEKERKGGAVPWYGASTAGAPGIPLGGMATGSAKVGASLSARSGLLGSGRIANAISQFFGGPSTFLGGLFASPLGSQIVLGGLLSWGAALGVAGYALMSRMPSSAAGTPMFPALGSVSSAIVIDRPKDRSLGMTARANQGELVWDQEHPLAPKEDKSTPPPEPEKAPETPKPPDFKMPDLAQLAGQKGLNANGFIKGLTNDTRQLNGAGAGGPKLKDGQSGFNLAKTFAPSLPGARQKLQSFGRQKSSLGVKKMSTNRARSSRAMGQLKFATDMSRSGNFSSNDATARQFETNAFDQGRTTGGEMLGMTDPGGVVVPPGSGVSDGLPNVGPATNVTPYQGNADAAQQAGNNAGTLKAIGVMMMTIGFLLIARGLPLMSNHTTFPIGAALVAAGTALVMMGIMLIAMGASQAKAGKQQAEKVGTADGQQEQKGVAQECIDMAFDQGKRVTEVCPDGVPPLDTSREGNSTSVREAVEAERRSTYRIGP